MVAALRTGRWFAIWLCPWPDRAGGCRIRTAAECGCPRLEQGLAAHQVVEFLFELLLIKQLTTGRAVDLGAQLRDAILIGKLLFRFAGDQRAQHVVAKCKIGCRRNRPDRHDDHGADGNPERDRSEPDLSAGMRKGVRGVIAARARGVSARFGASRPALDWARRSG